MKTEKKREKKGKELPEATDLKTGASGVALLLLGAINRRRLATGALSSRRFALAAGHCCDGGGWWMRGVDSGMRLGKKAVEINRGEKLCVQA